MKATTFAVLAAVTGFAATAAHAETRWSVNVGLNTPVYAPAPAYYPPAPVVVAPEPIYGASGHWENVTNRVWVPARYVESRDAWGRYVNVLEPAHYAYSTNRVWVEEHHRRYDRDDDRRFDRDDHHRYGRDEYRREEVRPGYGYDYGRR